LRHPDEHVYRLGALGLPAEDTTARAREAGAIELFAARVQALEPRFLVSEANVAAVVDICRRLDGIPLAIELAAARVPLLGVDGVRGRLDERFRLLTAGSRLAPAAIRHCVRRWNGATACSRSRNRKSSMDSGYLPAASPWSRLKGWQPMPRSTNGRSSITWVRALISRW
jgi:hypothetical protein